MPAQNSGLSARSLAELALVVSRVARSILDSGQVPSAASLRSYWQSNRSLQRQWLMILDKWTDSKEFDIEVLEQLAARVFTCEMVVRTWSTVLVGLDRQSGGDDLTRLTRNAVNGLQQVRNGILSRLLQIPGEASDRMIELDRLRRRCDRWTDLLVAPIAVAAESFEFAIDEERARDFGEEELIADPASGPHPVEHLVSAGLRLTFIQHLSLAPLDEPEFVALTQSILLNIPSQTFHRHGTLRTLLEQRIAASRQRQERRVNLDIRDALHNRAQSTTKSWTENRTQRNPHDE